MPFDSPIDEKFVKAVRRMEQRTNCAAWAVINPNDPEQWGRIVVSYPRDGAGRLYAIAWLPAISRDHDSFRHAASATGYGYDKKTAAMGGAQFFNRKTAQVEKLADQGYDFERQLRDAGYIVIRTV